MAPTAEEGSYRHGKDNLLIVDETRAIRFQGSAGDFLSSRTSPRQARMAKRWKTPCRSAGGWSGSACESCHGACARFRGRARAPGPFRQCLSSYRKARIFLLCFHARCLACIRNGDPHTVHSIPGRIALTAQSYVQPAASLAHGIERIQEKVREYLQVSILFAHLTWLDGPRSAYEVVMLLRCRG